MKKQLLALIAVFALTISCAHAETDTQKFIRYAKKLIKIGGVGAGLYLCKFPLRKAWYNSVDRTTNASRAVFYAAMAILLYESLN